jgi:hypothetical protein
VTIIESRIEAVWWEKQTAKGTPASTAFRRGRKVGGDLNVAREDASEHYSDGQRFNTAADFVNTIVGNGNPTVQAQAGVAGHLAYLMLGQETVTGAADPYTHVATPNAAGSFWCTFWKKVGSSVGPLRQKFNDCRIVSLRIEGSSAAKVVKLTPTFLSLDSGEVYSSDPVAVEEPGEPFLYTEAEGTFTIDGVVHRGHSSFAVVLNDNIQPWYGDSVVPFDVAYGLGNIVVENLTLAVDQQGLDRYNRQIYGVTNPPAGTKPLHTIPALGSYSFDLVRGSNYTVTLGSPSAGTFTLTVGASTTTGIAYNAAAAAVQAALEALPTVGTGNVVVTGSAGGPYAVKFVPAGVVMTGSGASLTGGTFTVTGAGAANRELKVELPGAKFSPDIAIAGNPDGGPVEMQLNAEARSVTGQPMIRITTKSADPAYT